MKLLKNLRIKIFADFFTDERQDVVEAAYQAQFGYVFFASTLFGLIQPPTILTSLMQPKKSLENHETGSSDRHCSNLNRKQATPNQDNICEKTNTPIVICRNAGIYRGQGMASGHSGFAGGGVGWKTFRKSLGGMVNQERF